MSGPNGTTGRRAQLQHLQATLLAAITVAGHRDLAALSRELRMVELELEQLGPAGPISKADEIKARRDARRRPDASRDAKSN